MEGILEGDVSFPTAFTSNGPIFGEANKEMTNILTSHVHLYKKWEEDKLKENVWKKII